MHESHESYPLSRYFSYQLKNKMPQNNNIIPLSPPNAEQHARAETERKRKLFKWADELLRQLGLADAIRRARTIAELAAIDLDVDNNVDVALAIRAALHPADGSPRAPHFVGMTKGMLKRLVKLRFHELKKDRAAQLAGRSGGAPGAEPWMAGLKLDAMGAVRPILTNLILFLREHPSWKGVIAYDDFAARVVIRKRPPWGDVPADALWTDHFDTLVRTWFQQQDINAKSEDCGRAVQAAARYNNFHPVRDYFAAHQWDNTNRLDSWLSTYLSAKDTPYTRAIGSRFLISAVARIYDPGCKADYILVLEGPQGKQKSEALRTLAVREAWFTDRLSAVATKDAAQETAGVFLIEVAEMEPLLRASSSATKAFITRRHDRYRPPYGKHTIRQPRQCVFAGTINPPPNGYLKDPTGARRIWPVTCRAMIDLAALARDRDQLWAEAVARFKAGEKWWLETPELEALATAEQDKRREIDPWQEPIHAWLDQQTNPNNTSSAEVLAFLGYDVRQRNASAESRVANILVRLGYRRYRANLNGKRSWRYRK